MATKYVVKYKVLHKTIGRQKYYAQVFAKGVQRDILLAGGRLNYPKARTK